MVSAGEDVSAAEAPTIVELSPEDAERARDETKTTSGIGRKADHLLDVRGLSTHFFTQDGVVQAVDDVSFTVGYGETLGLVGESGCGKSVTALSVARLVPDPPGKIVSGSKPAPRTLAWRTPDPPAREESAEKLSRSRATSSTRRIMMSPPAPPFDWMRM